MVVFSTNWIGTGPGSELVQMLWCFTTASLPHLGMNPGHPRHYHGCFLYINLAKKLLFTGTDRQENSYSQMDTTVPCIKAIMMLK
jgi:hypothetical protein